MVSSVALHLSEISYALLGRGVRACVRAKEVRTDFESALP